MQTNINITRAFVETPDGVLSIHQLSQRLKLPYGTAYNRIHALTKCGIIQMLPQGKAKLCALNPDNPMTAAILALGSAQKTDMFINNNQKTGNALRRISQSIYNNGKDSLETAILLTPTSLKNVLENSPQAAKESLLETDMSLDFFYLKNSNEFAEEKTEVMISSLMPPDSEVKITSMTVDRETLLGMLKENENEAGLAAYSMLYEGLILFGFENFYRLVLEAFAQKLSSKY